MIYLGLLVFTALGPLLFGWDPRVRFNQRWREWSPALLTTAVFFIGWDAWFTRLGVWGFNADYVGPIRIFGLPLEELAFFVIIPYACLFILNVTKYYDTRSLLSGVERKVTLGLIVGLIILATFTVDRTYPFVTSLIAAAVLTINYANRRPLAHFYLSYLVSLIPFFLVNGVLTGTGLAAPIVWYDDPRTLGLRIGTIPADDAIYLLAMLAAAEGGPLDLVRNLFNSYCLSKHRTIHP